MTSNGQFNQTMCTNSPVQNLSAPGVAITWLYTYHEIFLAKFILPSLLVIGVAGNTTFIYAVVRIKRLHSITNMYLVNLAVADILMLCAAIPVYMWIMYSSSVRYAVPWHTRVGCLTKAVTGYFYFTSLCLVSLVTLERYYAICHPFRHREINTKKRTVKLIATTWMLGLLFSICIGFGDGQIVRFCMLWPNEDLFNNFPSEVRICKTTDSNLVLLEELSKTIPFLIALVGNCFMYIRIMQTLGGRNLEPNDNTEHTAQSKFQSHANQVRNQVARLLIINGMIFFFCQIGTRVLSFHAILELTLNVGFLNSKGVGVILLVSRLMLFMNSVVNPIVYNLTSSIYRQAFKEAFCQRNCRHTDENRQSQNTYSMSITRHHSEH